MSALEISAIAYLRSEFHLDNSLIARYDNVVVYQNPAKPAMVFEFEWKTWRPMTPEELSALAQNREPFKY